MIKELPQKLHRMRIKYGYSQKQVADKLGVSASIISGYETGERTPSTELLLALSYLYNCSTDYLLGKHSADPSALVDVSGLTDPQVAAVCAVIKAFRGE